MPTKDYCGSSSVLKHEIIRRWDKSLIEFDRLHFNKLIFDLIESSLKLIVNILHIHSMQFVRAAF